MRRFGPQTLGRLWAQEAPKWGPSGAQVGAPRLHKGYKTQWIFTIVVWKQVKVAASNKTTKKTNKRALECSGPIGATPEEPQEARNGGPRASQEGPPGSQKGYKTQWILTICGLEASQGGTKQQD